MAELEPKKVILSQIIEDLNNGLSKWKKDDIGFGSLEKKYNLTQNEMIKLLGYHKLQGIEPKIPAFIIEDDLPDPQENTTIEVATPVVVQELPKLETTVVVKKQQPIEKPKPVAFI